MSTDAFSNYGAPEDDDYDDHECANCAGEGYVYSCQDEIGCIDPEGGCDLCMRRCDWCNPRLPKPEPAK